MVTVTIGKKRYILSSIDSSVVILTRIDKISILAAFSAKLSLSQNTYFEPNILNQKLTQNRAIDVTL